MSSVQESAYEPILSYNKSPKDHITSPYPASQHCLHMRRIHAQLHEHLNRYVQTIIRNSVNSEIMWYKIFTRQQSILQDKYP